MYSLYRAWLSLNPLPSLPVPLNLSLPPPGQIPEVPDVSLQVGPSMTHFSAHRNILMAHSGFFKATLSNYSGLTPISVPNVNVDEFSSLLTFMYTGYLDLNITNIYSILLATHILHMPRALEICRNFLMQQTNATSTETPIQKVNVIKPIPSRKLTPAMQECFNLTKSLQESAPDTHQASTSKNLEKTEQKLPVPSSNKSSANKIRNESNTKDSKIIVDVACCDGPVRFHRVINKNYGLQDTENYEVSYRNSFNQSRAMNKVMNENIKEKLNVEESNEVFTCVYCNHTFKSQYCYQKHARRHLYPVSVDKGARAEAKREVKLLDMNVQYYPCKTCGSKFPSYYFVHKHRKMCHAEEVADKNHKNNEIIAENVIDSREESSSCSAIDVEGVQNENEQEVT
ncbi:hypothetical protein ABEB36_007657 [Hypothenemus hampei]|uniref:Uncharacterized protein n=1 Tax=Hypothenemus hampei TaxID=57062 RepID=A0ABD1EUY5_HYPHA